MAMRHLCSLVTTSLYLCFAITNVNSEGCRTSTLHWQLVMNIDPSDGHNMGWGAAGWAGVPLGEQSLSGHYANLPPNGDWVGSVPWGRPADYIAVVRHNGAGQCQAAKVWKFKTAGLSMKDYFGNGYRFLFNGCCRGAAGGWSNKGNMAFDACQRICDADHGCNSVEQNGWNSDSVNGGGACYTFQGTIGGHITNGRCVTNGNQKCYAKVASDSVASRDVVTTNGAIYSEINVVGWGLNMEVMQARGLGPMLGCYVAPHRVAYPLQLLSLSTFKIMHDPCIVARHTQSERSV
jgi:hypothetical protein